MSDPWTGIRKAAVAVETGLDPDRYRFAVHPETRPAVEGALKQLGVRDVDLELFHVYDSEAVDLGQVLAMDATRSVVDQSPLSFDKALGYDPVSESLRRETRRLLSEHAKGSIGRLRS